MDSEAGRRRYCQEGGRLSVAIRRTPREPPRGSDLSQDSSAIPIEHRWQLAISLPTRSPLLRSRRTSQIRLSINKDLRQIGRYVSRMDAIEKRYSPLFAATIICCWMIVDAPQRGHTLCSTMRIDLSAPPASSNSAECKLLLPFWLPTESACQ